MAKSEMEAGPTGRTVADNMTRLRHGKFTLVQLSERTAELGRELSISTLSLIAKGKRRVDVDDLMVLAASLDVSPVTLLMPVPAAGGKTVAATGFPKGVAPAQLLEWMTGQQGLLTMALDEMSEAELISLTMEAALVAAKRRERE